MENISNPLSSLSDRKRELLKARLSLKTAKPDFEVINAQELPGPLPLSFAQESIWYSQELDPKNPVNNMSDANLRLRGNLQISALQTALKTIVERHQILRTNFFSMNGEPRQSVARATGFDLSVVDLSHLPEAEARHETERWLKQESQRFFNLADDFKLRAVLLRLKEDDHLLILTLHRIAGDSSSVGILLHELELLYDAFSRGKPSPLPSLDIQYVDYAVNQRERWDCGLIRRHLDYWKDELAGVTPILEVPIDRPRPKFQTFRGRQKRFNYDPQLLASLRELSNRERTTLFTVLLTGFQTLLHRYSSQDDIVIGVPLGARTNSQIENLIGLFLNVVPLRANFEGDPTFLELLRQSRTKMLAARKHMDYPVERLIKELRIPRHPNRNPLFQVIVQHFNSPPQPEKFGNLMVELPPPTDNQTAKFDLSLILEESPGGLKGNLEYNIDLFDTSTIDRMLGHYQTLLRAIVVNPSEKVSLLPLLTAPEQQQFMAEWDAVRLSPPGAMTVPLLFEQQVETTPGDVAVIFEDQQLTYRELNERVNQLAHYLRRRGLESGTLAAISLERSLEMVIGVLAVLKAGCAYVPLDPEYPQRRLDFMMADTCAPVLLTQERFKNLVTPAPGCQLVCLDSEWEKIGQEPPDNPVHTARPGNLAYVIYTSGSTGQPKGVMITHDSLCAHAHWMQETIPLTAQDRILQKAAFSFDVAVWEMFGPLLHGAQLVMAPPRIHRESAALVETIARKQITLLQTIPSQLRALLNEPELKQCRRLKHVIVGGEVLPPDLITRFYSELEAKLYNAYGPTENTIDATWHPCSPSDGELASVPIGRPIPQTRACILDKHLQPVPVGVPGELHLAGRGLARGYWRRAELNAEKFIPNPFQAGRNERLYKTGDLARCLPDGNIEFLGRMDHQVKIRGFRIELEEIEAALRQQPAVRNAVLAVQTKRPGDKQLIAYVVPEEGTTLKTTELRAQLKHILPDHMVPAVFTIMTKLPVTGDGKVDRRALPKPDAHPTREEIAHPRSDLEHAMVQIWRAVLGLQQIGIEDDFFELGGHSLLAAQILARVKETCGKHVSLRDLFEFPTISGLCSFLETSDREYGRPGPEPILVPLARKGESTA